ncbi:hypothetical protein [Streptomyces sp. B6B3]|uniref:hypothetical protein n=1 Tax=Streptomyces sp. B6B3 TaxID=3153570 RepID=UPI00325D382B
MSHSHPQTPQEPDPAASTQMFQAFVNGEASGGTRPSPSSSPMPAAPAPAPSSGPRLGLILGVVLGIAVLAAVAWLALG